MFQFKVLKFCTLKFRCLLLKIFSWRGKRIRKLNEIGNQGWKTVFQVPELILSEKVLIIEDMSSLRNLIAIKLRGSYFVR